jgi:hypothetical protein
MHASGRTLRVTGSRGIRGNRIQSIVQARLGVIAPPSSPRTGRYKAITLRPIPALVLRRQLALDTRWTRCPRSAGPDTGANAAASAVAAHPHSCPRGPTSGPTRHIRYGCWRRCTSSRCRRCRCSSPPPPLDFSFPRAFLPSPLERSSIPLVSLPKRPIDTGREDELPAGITRRRDLRHDGRRRSSGGESRSRTRTFAQTDSFRWDNGRQRRTECGGEVSEKRGASSTHVQVHVERPERLVRVGDVAARHECKQCGSGSAIIDDRRSPRRMLLNRRWRHKKFERPTSWRSGPSPRTSRWQRTVRG